MAAGVRPGARCQSINHQCVVYSCRVHARLPLGLLLAGALAICGCGARQTATPKTLARDSLHGLAAEIAAFRPASHAPLPDELRGVSTTPLTQLERVIGQYDMLHASVTAAAFMPDGRTAVSVGRAGDVVVWDTISRAEKARLGPCRPGAGETTGLVVVADGRAIAQADSGGWVCIRNLADGKVIRSWPAHEAPVRTLAATRRGDLITYGYQSREYEEAKPRVILKTEERDGRVRRWRLDADEMVSEFAIGPEAAVKVAPDGSSVVARGTDGRFRAWDEVGRKLWETEKSLPGTFAFVSGGRLLVAEGTRIHLLEAASGKEIGELVRTTPIAPPLLSWMAPPTWSECLVVAPDGRKAITSLMSDSHVFIWDIEERREAAHVTGRDLAVCGADASFSPDGTVLMTAGSDHLRFWDFGRTAPLPDRAVRIVAASSDCHHVVTYSDDQLTRVLDLDGGSELARWPARNVRSVAFSIDGRRITETPLVGEVRVIDATSGAIIGTRSAAEVADDAASTPPPALITVTRERTGTLIRVHRRVGGGMREILVASRLGEILSTAVTPDGARLVAGTERGVLLVFRL
jgi:WD40 repeat protein